MAAGDELFDAEHPPLIERSVFLRNQELLKAATKIKKIAARNPEFARRSEPTAKVETAGTARPSAST